MADAIIHVSGPFGVGKTTLLKKVKKTHPEVKYICLDGYEDLVKKTLGLKKGWRHHGGWEKYKEQVRQIRRKAFQEDMIKYGNKPRKLVIFDSPFEWENELEFNVDAEYKILLTRPLEQIVSDRIKRDSPYAINDPKRYQELDEHHRKQTKDHMKWNLSCGYKPMTPDEAYEFINGKLGEPAARIAARISNSII